PRIGALDVLPFVPLVGLTQEDAVASARRVGERLAREVGIPVYFYAQAADPVGRGLAELRAGGYELLVQGWPPERVPDVLPPGWSHAGVHPTAGATCVGARPLLLAWNVFVEGVERETAAQIARKPRASARSAAADRPARRDDRRGRQCDVAHGRVPAARGAARPPRRPHRGDRSHRPRARRARTRGRRRAASSAAGYDGPAALYPAAA